MRVLIDGDGCPVIKQAINISKERDVEVIIFIDTAHILNDDYAKVITVDKGNDKVDFALVNSIIKDDIVITQDYGLASMALAKKAKVLNQNGLIFTDYNIDSLLNNRHFAKIARKTRGSHKYKNMKKRTRSDDEGFTKAFIGLFDYEK